MATLLPHSHLRALRERYPAAQGAYQSCLDGRGHELPDWPPYVWCPMAAAHAIVYPGDAAPTPAEILARGCDVARVAALSAWRATQGVYRYDPALLAALVRTPGASIPPGVLRALPEWCVYLDWEGLAQDALPGCGAYVHLEHDPYDGREELRILLAGRVGTADADWQCLLPLIVHLTDPDTGAPIRDLAVGVRTATEEALRQARHLPGAAATDPLLDLYADPAACVAACVAACAPILSLVLYLCSDQPDVRSRRRPESPLPTRPPRPLSAAPARGQDIREVGYRVGARLRDAETARAALPASPSGRHVAPHVRRAHWHLYWTGTGRTVPVVRWLHPILVRLDPESPGTTIHRIGDPS